MPCLGVGDNERSRDANRMPFVTAVSGSKTLAPLSNLERPPGLRLTLDVAKGLEDLAKFSAKAKIRVTFTAKAVKGAAAEN